MNTDPPLPEDVAGEQFLRAICQSDSAAPVWMASVLQGQIVVAVLDAEPLGELEARCHTHQLSESSWMVAEDDADIAGFTAAIRRHMITGRAAIACAPGVLGLKHPLGQAPKVALEAFEALDGVRQIWVNASVHAVLNEPAAMIDNGFLLAPAQKRGWAPRWAFALAAAAIVCMGLGWSLYTSPDPVTGQIYVFPFHAQTERSTGPWQTGDQVTVRLEGEPGTFATLLLLDSQGRWHLTKVHNQQLTAAKTEAQLTLAFDGVPGEERFVGLVARAPLTALGALVKTLNTLPNTSVTHLDGRLEKGTAIVPATPLVHR